MLYPREARIPVMGTGKPQFSEVRFPCHLAGAYGNLDVIQAQPVPRIDFSSSANAKGAAVASAISSRLVM
ncbi:MAG TPA: hypothetical protein VH157_02390 [Bryobacteraceae bacterium]|nr:hypothetical protein [Bryobacteraceae bacterium]